MDCDKQTVNTFMHYYKAATYQPGPWIVFFSIFIQLYPVRIKQDNSFMYDVTIGLSCDFALWYLHCIDVWIWGQRD